MKERHLFTLLSVEAAACVLFCILQRSLSGLFSTLIAFPFEQIGAGLRVLSLSGAVGNVVAIILYMLLGLIPAGIWGFLHWRKKSEPLDIMLLVISALLFVTLYYMINPGLLSTGVPGTGKWSLGSTFYSVLLGYLLIRILLHYKMQERRNCKGALVPSWHCERGIGVWHLWTGAGRAASESGNGTEGKYRHRAKRRFYYFFQPYPYLCFPVPQLCSPYSAICTEYYSCFPGEKASGCNEGRPVSGRECKTGGKTFPLLRVDLSIHYWAGGGI